MGSGASKDNSPQPKDTKKKVNKGKQQEERTQKKESRAKISDVTVTVVRVNVSKSGFWPPAVTIKEGQCVLFIWNEPGGNGHNVRQVVYDGVKIQSAIGGYKSGDLQPQGKYKIHFNLEGEFKFVSDGFHNNSKPFVVSVHSRSEIPAEINDEQGFSPAVLRINQGNTVKWLWHCTSPRIVFEVKLCHKHTGFLRTNAGTSAPTQSGSYKHEFNSPGLYYFQTEGEEEGKFHLCIVQVKEIQREFRIEVTDRKFNPRLIRIHEGDRVWWEWDRLKCRKGHNIIQVDVPQYSEELDPYPRPVKGGFRCEGPSRSGILSHVFTKTGVFYYCDQDYDDNREYLGVIIVYPKEKEHYIELTGDGFYPDLGAISAGDRVWWIWNPEDVQDNFSIMEVDRCTTGDTKAFPDQDCNNICTYIDNNGGRLISSLGIETIQLNTVGVYHYRVSDSPITVGCSSIIVNPKTRNHTVVVSDDGFEPRVSTLNPGDRVWWIWDNSFEQHNIIQVSHQGRPIKDGFCSGAPLDSPGAFVYQFKETGVYYFISMGQPKAFGAIVVSSQPQVTQVRVSKNTIQPDPALALTNDVVVWMWPGLRKHGITQVADTQQVYELQSYTQDVVTPRRCFGIRFSNPGVYHYYSKAFSGNDDKYLYEHSSKSVLSTIIVNNASDSTVVRVTAKGFKPNTVNILRGHNILWSWKDSGEESHNIMHVNPPHHEKPFSPVSDETAFNSGPPIPNNSFIYTFDEPGSYYVTSQGNPGIIGMVNVLDKDQFKLTAMPVITSENNGGPVQKWHVVNLQCNTENSTIFYTLDGSNPEYHGPSTKIYKPKGIVLRDSGLQVIRAMATSEEALNSKIFTSKRFWVLEGEDQSEPEAAMISSEENSDDENQELCDTTATIKWHWWNCVPEIQGWFVEPGCVEIYWELPEEDYRPQIKTYQVYVNNVCYCEALPKDCHSICVIGLAGHTDYIVKIVALPKEAQFLPQESNKLRVHVPGLIDDAGPLISSEIQDDEDIMAIVWMPILEKDAAITGYRLYVNDQKCGDEVVPDEGSNKCKVLIQGCDVNTPYRVQVLAVPKENKDVLVSNELLVILPQTTAHIILPPGRSLSEEELQGYITVSRGSGKPPGPKQELLPSTELAMDLDIEKSNTHTETILTQANIHLEEQTESQVKEHAVCGASQENVNVLPDDTNDLVTFNKTTDVDAVPDAEQSVWKASSCESNASSEHEGGVLEQEKHQNDESHDEQIEDTGHEQTSSDKESDHVILDKESDHVVSDKESDHMSNKENDHVVSDQERNDTVSDEEKNLVVQDKEPEQIVSDKESEKVVSDQENCSETENAAEPHPSPSLDHPMEKPENDLQEELEDNVDEKSSKKSVAKEDHDVDTSDFEISSDSDGTVSSVSFSISSSDQMHVDSIKSDAMHDNNICARNVEEGGDIDVGANNEEEEEHDYRDGGGGDNGDVLFNVMHDKGLVHAGSDDDDDDNDEMEGRERGNSIDGDLNTSAQEKEKKKKKKKKKKKRKAERAIDAVAKAQKQIQELPVPRCVECRSNAITPEITVDWQSDKSRSKTYIFQHYLVCIIGTKYGDVQSHNSFEKTDLDGKTYYQHCWTVKEDTQLKISGLAESIQYRVFVSSVYSHKKRSEETVELKSEEVTCVSGGRPAPPVLTVSDISLQQVCLSWEPGLCHPDIITTGYLVYINGKVLGEQLSADTTASQIQDIEIGSQHHVYVESVTDMKVGNSDSSNVITIIAPEPQEPPNITSLPSVKNHSALVAWEKPRGPDSKLIAAYRIYVDGKENGELDVKKAESGGKFYQYYITDLQPSVSYDITVRTYTGQKEADLSTGSVYCGVLGPPSNVLPVMCTAPPRSPRLRLEGLHSNGIDVTWEIPQQYGDAALSGFQLVKDGKLYGSIISPDILCATICDVSLGDIVTLQLIALTNHPVGRLENEESIASSSDSGFDNTSATVHEDKEPPLMEKYSACKPGPRLSLNYTGLVQPPSKVWAENITGHSAVIAWSIDEKKKKHYVSPENYQVTWWPGDNPDKDIRSQSTAADHLTISTLTSATKYTVVVEARRAQMYNTFTEEDLSHPDERGSSVFILTAQSEQFNITTGRPPEPPSNLGVITSTCNSLHIAWHSPVEHSVEVTGLRVYVSPSENDKVGLSQCIDLVPDSTSLTIHDLSENTEYDIHIMAMTDEYFDQLPSKSKHKKKSRTLTKDWDKVAKSSPWLPYSTIHATTSGTQPPGDVTCVRATMDTIVVKWTPPQVQGTNRLQSCMVRWTEVKPSKLKDVAISRGVIKVDVEDSMAEITGLTPGKNYRIFVETHILVKMSIDEQRYADSDSNNYRNAQVTSEAIVVRTKAPVDPPEMLLTGYSSNHITLYWEKPVLFTPLPKKDVYGCSNCIKRTLIGYRLEVNGRTHTKLGPAAQNCTLTKCKADKKYTIVLVALTTTDKDHKKRRKKVQMESKGTDWRASSAITIDRETYKDDQDEYDEAVSKPVEVVLPRPQPGALVSLVVDFTRNASKKNANEHRFGFLRVQWSMQVEANETASLSENGIQGFDISYTSTHDNKEHTTALPITATSYEIPIKAERSVYDISVQPAYDDDYYYAQTQSVQFQCPGSPEPPQLSCPQMKHTDHFNIEWGEPKLYGGVEIKGYQAYMNDKKIGNVLHPSHRKAVIPSRPQTQYVISMVALSADKNFDDSLPSEDLVIVTPSEYQGSDTYRSTTSTASTCSVDTMNLVQDISVYIIDVTDNTVTLNWTIHGIDDRDIKYIKVQWSSVASPQVLDTKLASDETDYTIYRCAAGTNHFIRVFAIGRQDKVICKSKQLTIQTSAAITTPILSLRSCTFTHITVAWQEPRTYGDTQLKGYKLVINGMDDIEILPHVTTYTFTKGEMCKEYKFTIQALCNKENLHSSMSNPLVVIWPGVLPPVLRRVPTNKRNSLKVAWNDLYTTGGIKIAEFKGICEGDCYEERKGRKGLKNIVKRQEVGPLHPEIRVVEFINLLPNIDYNIYLEIKIHGLDSSVKSEPIMGKVASVPGPPDITLKVHGVEARTQLDAKVCDYINQRDRLLQQLDRYQSSSPFSNKPNVQIARLTSTIADVETNLLQCLQDLQPYSGTFEVDIEWEPAEDDGDAIVTGYQILVNDKPHGNLLNAYVQQTRLKLSAYVPVHKVSVVTVTNHPVGNSEPSNMIPVYSELFLPYAFFCFHSVHTKDAQYPNEGCCTYSDSLAREMDPDSLGSYTIAAVNMGLLKRRVPPAAVTVLDVFEGAWHLLIPTKLRKPTVILFWTKWCLASRIAMNFFVRYSREHGKRISFITCCCASYESTSSHRHSLAEVIVGNAWRNDRSIRHCCSCHSSTPGPTSSRRSTSSSGKRTGRTKLGHDDLTSSSDSLKNVTGVPELFGIQGVPTFVVINPEGLIAWQGRFAACDYTSFQTFTDHILCEAMDVRCHGDCELCQVKAKTEEPKLTPIPGNPRSVRVTISEPPEVTSNWFEEDTKTGPSLRPLSSKHKDHSRIKKLSPTDDTRPHSAMEPSTHTSLKRMKVGRPKSSYSQ
ncbi:uncharacterized protein LOC144434231 [Glandiceps talaboti]